MGVNNLPKSVTRQRRGCDLNPGPSAPESSTLTTRLPSSFCIAYEEKAPYREMSLILSQLMIMLYQLLPPPWEIDKNNPRTFIRGQSSTNPANFA